MLVYSPTIFFMDKLNLKRINTNLYVVIKGVKYLLQSDLFDYKTNNVIFITNAFSMMNSTG